MKQSEETLAAKVVAWLEENQYDVYQEVCAGLRTKSADIVVKMPSRLSWAIEVKTSLSLDVIRQAHGWIGKANYVSVAVPAANTEGRRFSEKVLRGYGIGLIEVGKYDSVYESVHAAFNRSAGRWLADSLLPEQKVWGKAGNANGDRFSPYARTCLNLLNYVRQRPGCFFKQAIENIDTHYNSITGARSALYHWLKLGKIKGVRLVKECNRLKLYPEK